MPRTARASQGGYVYHVLNRGNGRADVFHNDEEFAAFVNLMGGGSREDPDAIGRLLFDDQSFSSDDVAT